MSDGLGNFTKNWSQTNVSTKNGTGPNENDIIAQWNQDIKLECILQYIIEDEFK
jgi:hypothetical protein